MNLSLRPIDVERIQHALSNDSSDAALETLGEIQSQLAPEPMPETMPPALWDEL